MNETRTPAALEERRRVLESLRRHGWNATSFQTLEPSFRYWFSPDGDCVAWVDAGGARVVAGAPIAAPERMAGTVRGFLEDAKRERKRVSFFAIERRFLSMLPLNAIAVGEQPWWNPQGWADRRRRHRSIREQAARARARGVTVESVAPGELARGSPLREAMDALIRAWVASRRMPLMAFLVEVEPFEFREERRFWIARRGEELVALLVAVPVYARDGWFFEDLLRSPGAPNGAVEMLVDAAMTDLAATGCRYVTLGLVPLGGDALWHRVLRALLAPLYDFDGLRAFKAKLRPDGWDPIFLGYAPQRTAPGALWDVLAAFARGRPFRFGAAAVLRNPSLVLWPVAASLVPWMVLLAMAPAGRWFPTEEVKAAWIVFDGMLALAIAGLARRWNRRAATALLGVTVADVLLTGLQLAAFNAARIRGAAGAALMALAIAALAGFSLFLAFSLAVPARPGRSKGGTSAR